MPNGVPLAAFLHVAPGGMRFNGPDLGAWYAAGDIRTAAAEVGHHLRREAVARGVSGMTRVYRAYTATLQGAYLDIRGQQSARPELYASNSYAAAQKFGETLRAAGGAGLLYDSLRRRTGVNVVAHRPRNIAGIAQTTLKSPNSMGRNIEIRKLKGPKSSKYWLPWRERYFSKDRIALRISNRDNDPAGTSRITQLLRSEMSKIVLIQPSNLQ